MQRDSSNGEQELATVSFYSPVQEFIPLVEDRMREQAIGHHPDLRAAMNHLLDAGGKRVRPIICLLAGGMLGAGREKSITLAAAVELLHTATLVHDDMIDGALLRRGIPTINASWSPGATILTGDFIFARAAKLAAETDSIEVMNLFAKTLSTIVNGEVTQMFSSKGLVSRPNYFERIYAKTASMFELAASAPVFLAGFGEQTFEALRTYGYEVGMAFQIMDDILDFTSEESNIGKPAGSDLRNGLITLPALHYLEQFPGEEGIVNLANGRMRAEEDIERLIENIRDSGAVSAAADEAKGFVDRGLLALGEMPDCPERLALEELAHYVVQRAN